jgi:predicted DNA-binding WGR domain protein
MRVPAQRGAINRQASNAEPGQSKTKPFDSAQKAATERDKLILEKTSKGYSEGVRSKVQHVN